MKFPLSIPDTNIDFVSKRLVAFVISISLTIATISLLFVKGLNLGIDFTGGIIIEVRLSKQVNVSDIRGSLSSKGYSGINVQKIDNSDDFSIRMQPQENNADEIESIKDVIKNLDSSVTFRKVDFVGPRVGQDLIERGVLAMVLALAAMMLYIWVRFDWQFSIGAIIALVHDMLTTIGFYVVTGFEFDLTSIAVLLTVIGYSINDSVVIFDRVRENMRKYKITEFVKIINLSVNETLSRTILTSLTTMVVCLALVLFGGKVLLGFSMAMLFGVFFGTYSSIYIASPILMHTYGRKS